MLFIQCLVLYTWYSNHCILCKVFFALYFTNCSLCIVFYALHCTDSNSCTCTDLVVDILQKVTTRRIRSLLHRLSCIDCYSQQSTVKYVDGFKVLFPLLKQWSDLMIPICEQENI